MTTDPTYDIEWLDDDVVIVHDDTLVVEHVAEDIVVQFLEDVD